MKKIIVAFLLIIIVLPLFKVTAFASDKLVEVDLNSADTITSEKKIICNATTNDEFEEDSVIVVINNVKSKELKKYTQKDFSEVLPVSIENLTAYTESRIELQRCQMSNREKESVHITTVGETFINENCFHQIIKLGLDIKGKQNVLNCIKKLEQHEDVLMAFPNYIYKSAQSANDTLYSNQWAIPQISLPQAWDITTGNSSIMVGVIDSGIDGTHEDLCNRVETSLSKDFTGSNSPLTDEGGHGTVVAGVIGAQGNNSKCIAGTCWDIRLVSLKAAIPSGGNCLISTSRLINAIDYAAGNNIPILNCSYSVGQGNDLNIALTNFDGLFICSAGNERQDITNMNLCSGDYGNNNVITVAATNENDILYTYYDSNGNLKGSNYSATKVHLAAPGEGIYTTSIASSGYSSPSGTSMAAPFVAGVAALLKSKYPGMDAEALKDYILSNVDVISALNGKVVTGGRLNAYKALTNLKNYTVQYNANGGGGVGYLPTTMIYGCATPLNRNNFGKSGHSFVGWHAKRTDNNKWFYTNGSDSDWYTEGSQPSGYSKYTFSDGEAISRTIEPGKTMVMYAQWEKRFNIQFMGNNATSGTVADMVISEGQNYTLPSSGFTRTGCTLQYWYAKDSDGNYYFSNNGDKIWHSMSNIPSGYVRTQYAPGSVITANDVDGIDYDETIYMYAYWQPNSGLLGDVNGDGDINVKDSTKIQSYVSDLTTLTAAQLIRADVDFSGVVNTKDATAIQKYSSGVLAYFG